MSPSPVVPPSPAPSFNSGFSTFAPVIDKSSNEFSAHFPAFQSSCNVGNISLTGGQDIYAAFDDSIHQPSATLAHVDFDFSAFLTSIPQYAM